MGFIRFVGRLLAVLFLLIFIVVLPATLWAYNFQERLLNQPAYPNLLSDARFHAELAPDALAAALTTEIEAGNLPGQAAYTVIVLENAPAGSADAILPIEVAREKLGQLYSGAAQWLNSTELTPTFALETDTIAANLAGDPGDETIEAVVASWPVCNEGQTDQIRETLESGAGRLPACQPEGDLADLLTSELAASFALVAESLPETITLEETGSVNQKVQAKVVLRVIDRLNEVIFVLPAALLFAIHATTIRSRKALFGWFGAALLVGGLIALALTQEQVWLALWPLLEPRLDAVSTLIFYALGGAVSNAQRLVLIQAGIVTAIGLLFTVLGIVSESPVQEEEVIEEITEVLSEESEDAESTPVLS